MPSKERRIKRASGLKLVVAAIILWNSVYLEKAIEELSTSAKVHGEFLTSTCRRSDEITSTFFSYTHH